MELGMPEDVPLPNRWQLRTIRASIPELAHYSLSGVWTACRRAGVRWRQARRAQFSPDPDYSTKREVLLTVLRAMAADPEHIVVVFLDEMGYRRHPVPARTMALAAPLPPPQTEPAGKDELHRIAGLLAAYSGRVLTVDGHDAGRDRLAQLYRNLDTAYPLARRIVVVQDNWPVHAHADLDALLTTLPRIERLWLPIGAHWLNPIEKLWRLLRHDVLALHRMATDWTDLHRAVRRYLRQFDDGSPPLLDAVGLLGDGLLARARRGELAHCSSSS
jgi:transposase